MSQATSTLDSSIRRDFAYLRNIRNKKYMIFDLNGILCSCDHWENGPEGRRFHTPESRILSNIVPTLINKKAVFVRPGFQEFWTRINEVAYGAVWSSMAYGNVHEIVKFMFSDLPKPVSILTGKDCHQFLSADKNPFNHNTGRRSPLSLKIISKHLWGPAYRGEGFRNTEEGYLVLPENTLLIDDSPEKSICNPDNNAIFPLTWHGGFDRHDEHSDLVQSLLPYLVQVAESPWTVPDFVNHERLGRNPVDRTSKTFRELIPWLVKQSLPVL